MTQAPQSNALASIAEVLVATPDPYLRDRLLLEALDAAGVACAAALWKRPAGDSEWREVLARGDEDLLPTASQVEAVAEHVLDPSLPESRTVLVAQHGERLWALALGDVRKPGDLDLFEALLLTALLVEDADAARMDAMLDTLAPALPSGRSWTRAADPRKRHDLRNLMTSIGATNELLHKFPHELTSEERVRFSDVLEREFKRAGNLLYATLRADSGPVPANWCEPGSVVRDVATSELSAVRAAGLVLEVDVDPAIEREPCAIGEVELTRIVQNLLVNAREALADHGMSGGGRRIRVAVRSYIDGPGAVLVEVEDDGPGIAPEHLPYVFDEGFTRGKPTGSGYGLAVVRDLVHAAGGFVEAGNLTPNGAIFRVLLPTVSCYRGPN